MLYWRFCLVDLDPSDEEQQRLGELDKNDGCGWGRQREGTADPTETEKRGNRVDDFANPDMP